MQVRILFGALLLLSLVARVEGAPLEPTPLAEEGLAGAEALYAGGDLEGARRQLTALLAADGDSRAPALLLLGRVEVEAGRWREALAAWSELVTEHPEASEASLVTAALRPLEALAGCDCAGAAAGPPPIAEATAETAPAASAASAARESEPAAETPSAPSVAEPSTPTVETAPDPTPGSASGVLLAGGWSKQFEASQEATQALAEFLEEAGVAVRFVPTDVAAARGEQVTLSFLLEQAEESGAAGVLYFTMRFSHRDFVAAERYDPRGMLLWKEKVHGGTELKASRERGKVRWALVERLQDALSKRLGTPDLPTD